MMIRKDSFKYFKASYSHDMTVLDATISSFKYKKHGHNDYALGLTTSGYQCFYCNGSFYRVPRGGIIQINPEEPHDGYSQDAYGYSYYMLYIPKYLLYDALNAYSSIRIKDFRFNKTVIDDDKLVNRFIKLVNAIKQNNQDALYIDELFLKVIESLIENNTNLINDRIANQNKDPIIVKAKDYINENIYGKLELDEICKMINISKYHFIRIFKNQTSRTPYQYILDRKISLARKDLERGANILSIIQAYGFFDLSHFIKRFKEVYGITPQRYQKSF